MRFSLLAEMRNVNFILVIVCNYGKRKQVIVNYLAQKLSKLGILVVAKVQSNCT